jgi:hypothetical protein
MAISEKLAQEVNKDMKRIRGESKPQGYIAIRTENYWTAIAFEDYLRAKENNVKQVKN